MTAEQLLTRRYKVIADYPNSPFTLGRIYKIDDFISSIDPAKYPGIFRELVWWESRDIADFPKFGKLLDDVADLSAGDVIKFGKGQIKKTKEHGIVFTQRGWKYSHYIQWVVPATEQEYLAYRNQKNKPEPE